MPLRFAARVKHKPLGRRAEKVPAEHTLHEHVRRRQQRALEAIGAHGLDALIAVGRAFYDRPGMAAWLTNHFPPFPTAPFAPGFQGLGHAVFVLTPQRGLLVVDTPLYREELVVADEVRPSADLVAATLDVLRPLAGRRLGLADGELLPLPIWQAWQAHLSAEWVSVDEVLWPLRRVKDSYELAMLRHAAQVADAGLRAAREAAQPGATESEVCAAGTAAALAAGADFVRYLRVHSGPWSAWSTRWPQATDRRLRAGDLVVLDIIGAVNGYAFDVLRTVCVGSPTDEQARLLEAIHEATDLAVALARPGTSVRHLCESVQTLLADRGYPDAAAFLGHGIGIETVELPYLRADQDETLLAGEVLCVEPGVWRPGWGGACCEQEVVVGEDPELITSTPLWTP